MDVSLRVSLAQGGGVHNSPLGHGQKPQAGAAMTREDICTCGQYSQCPTCGKSRSNYAELMKENERMKAALHLIAHYPAARWSSDAFRAACDHLAGIAQMALTEVEE